MSIIDMTNLETRNRVVVVTVIHALSIELGTGMKVSRGVQPVAVAKHYGFTGRTKKAALAYMVGVMQELDPGYVVSSRVTQLLAS